MEGIWWNNMASTDNPDSQYWPNQQDRQEVLRLEQKQGPQIDEQKVGFAAKVIDRCLSTLRADLANLIARCEALEIQARTISVVLSDAGCNAMTIQEGVRWLLGRAEDADARCEALELERDAWITREQRQVRKRHRVWHGGHG